MATGQERFFRADEVRKTEAVESLGSPLVWSHVPRSDNYDALEAAQRLATAFVIGKTLDQIEAIDDERDPYYCVKQLLSEHPMHRDDRDDYRLFQDAFKTVIRAIGASFEDISRTRGLAQQDYYRLSVSWSYFDQKEEKDAVWHQLGSNKALWVANSNMEDYHVFRVLESMLRTGQEKYPQLAGYSAIRLTANPNASKLAIAALEHWLHPEHPPTYGRDDYVKTIAWGLKGCPTEDIPSLPHRVNRWDACYTFDKPGNRGHITGSSSVKDYIYVVKLHGQNYYMDPFCMDLAQDFLKEWRAELEQAGVTKTDLDVSQVLGDQQALERKVGAVVDTLFQQYPDFSAPDGNYYMWLRNKWNQGPSRVLRPGVKVKDFDRLLYRSGNVFALRNLPDTVVERH